MYTDQMPLVLYRLHVYNCRVQYQDKYTSNFVNSKLKANSTLPN